MKLIIDKNFIYSEDGAIVAVLTDDCPISVKREIAFGSETLPMIKDFIAGANSGSLRPKTTVDKFQALIDKHEL